jgi:hypothetical protein
VDRCLASVANAVRLLLEVPYVPEHGPFDHLVAVPVGTGAVQMVMPDEIGKFITRGKMSGLIPLVMMLPAELPKVPWDRSTVHRAYSPSGSFRCGGFLTYA